MRNLDEINERKNDNIKQPVISLAELEKLRLRYVEKFTYGDIIGVVAFQNANPIEVWKFFIEELPKIIKCK